MAVTGPEPIIDGLVALLAEQLPAAIDQVNTEVNDDITLARGDVQVLPYVPHILTINQWPTIGIAEGPIVWEIDNGNVATARNEFHVVCYLQDADQAALTKRLRRLRLAVLRALLTARREVPNPAGGPAVAYGVGLRRLEPGQTLGEADAEQVKTWMSSTRLVITALSDETFD